AKEHGEDGFFAWSAGRARLALCDPPPDLTLHFRALNPDLAEHPLHLSIKRIQGGVSEMLHTATFADTEWQPVSLTQAVNRGEEPVILALEVSRVWSPADAQGVGDWRLLGVMMKWPEGVCSAEHAMLAADSDDA
ncbi:MAG: hypothetical protein KDD69_15830, partial [Bdellovibrionales bacterium]|nr:hypothetical protein [Bdellovibrionales bacterium]